MRAVKGWGRPRFLVLLGCLASIPFLADGKVAGDERPIFDFARDFYNSPSGLWSFLHGAPRPYLMHHMVWFLENCLYFPLYVFIARVSHIPYLLEYLFTFNSVFYMVLSVFFAYVLLADRLGHDRRVAAAAVAGLYFGSYGVSFMTGGYIDCLVCLLMVARLFVVEKIGPVSTRQALALAVIDGLLVSTKAYTALFLVLTLPYNRLFQRRKWAPAVGYFLLAGAIAGTILLLKLSAASLAWYETLNEPYGPAVYVGRVIAELFSFTGGLFWSIPWLLLAAAAWPARKTQILVKTAACILLLLFFANFWWWEGIGSVAGHRYMFPFLLSFLPEVALGLTVVLRRWRAVALVLPVLVLTFLPVLDYRNMLVGRYLQIVDPKRADLNGPWLLDLPFFDPSFHPAVFAWRVTIAKLRRENSFHPALTRDWTFDPTDLPPMPGVARMAYVLEHPAAAAEPVRALHKAKLDNAAAWQALRLGFMAAILTIAILLGWALYRRPQSDPEVI